MHCGVDGETLLALWERAVAQPPGARADALLGAGDAAAQCSPGARNARLAGLHTRCFGAELELLSHCPSCGAAAQFSGDCAALAAAGAMPQDASRHRLVLGDHGVDFRLPSAADVGAVAARADEAFARELLERCLLSCTFAGESVPAGELPLAVLDALSQRMESLDPAASVSFAVACPQCATPWEARLDLGQIVWQKVQGAAERLLLDIDVLARSYGWSEGEVLALSATRRAAYVQLAAS